MGRMDVVVVPKQLVMYPLLREDSHVDSERPVCGEAFARTQDDRETVDESLLGFLYGDATHNSRHGFYLVKGWAIDWFRYAGRTDSMPIWLR